MKNMAWRKDEIMKIIDKKNLGNYKLLRSELLSKKLYGENIFISKVDLDDFLQRKYYLNHKSKRKTDYKKFVNKQNIEEYRSNGKFAAYWVR